MRVRREWLLAGAAAIVMTLATVLGAGAGGAQDPTAAIGGSVEGADGPVGGVVVDLFAGDRNGSRLAYLRSATTDAAGNFGFELDQAGCHVLTFIAPGDATWERSGTTWLNQLHCVDVGQRVGDADATLAGPGAESGLLAGTVVDRAGRARSGVAVDLFQANGDGSRGRWLTQVVTDGSGRFGFEPETPACYVLTYIAPGRETWERSGTTWLNQAHCLETGQRIVDARAVLLAEPERDPDPDPDPGVEREILDLVNEARVQAGCAPLSLDGRLNQAARGHSEDMAARGYLRHTSPDGVGPGERIADTGYPARTWGENIASGYGTAESVMAGWMSSDGHRRNILNCSFEDLGVGYATNRASNDRPYWTQVFGATR
ncbi:MAG: CAP domain-containing protein [Actinomycetota bacterium]